MRTGVYEDRGCGCMRTWFYETGFDENWSL
jgi:hypothetical protein